MMPKRRDAEVEQPSRRAQTVAREDPTFLSPSLLGAFKDLLNFSKWLFFGIHQFQTRLPRSEFHHETSRVRQVE